MSALLLGLWSSLLTLFGLGISWLINRIFKMLDDLREEDELIRRDMSNTYVRRDDHMSFQKQILKSLERIEDKRLLNCNEFMIGIENVGYHEVPFTEAQYTANAHLCAWLMAEYGFETDMIAGHEDVAIPRGRKQDPGPSFDWHHLHQLIEDHRRRAS